MNLMRMTDRVYGVATAARRASRPSAAIVIELCVGKAMTAVRSQTEPDTEKIANAVKTLLKGFWMLEPAKSADAEWIVKAAEAVFADDEPGYVAPPPKEKKAYRGSPRK